MHFLAIFSEDQGTRMDNSYTKAFVYGYDAVIDTLEKLRNSGKDFIAILNNPDERILIGVAKDCCIGRYLATKILQKIKADGGEGERGKGCMGRYRYAYCPSRHGDCYQRHVRKLV